jgi:hypothetical protein
MAEIVRQSRTLFGGGNAMGNLISGNATFDYIFERTDKSREEIFDDHTMVPFMKAVRGEVAHNPWLFHDSGRFDLFDMDDIYLGTCVLHRLFYDLGNEIYGNAIGKVVNLEPFKIDLNGIQEGQDSLGWVYHEDEDGWNKTK